MEKHLDYYTPPYQDALMTEIPTNATYAKRNCRQAEKLILPLFFWPSSKAAAHSSLKSHVPMARSMPPLNSSKLQNWPVQKSSLTGLSFKRTCTLWTVSELPLHRYNAKATLPAKGDMFPARNTRLMCSSKLDDKRAMGSLKRPIRVTRGTMVSEWPNLKFPRGVLWLKKYETIIFH